MRVALVLVACVAGCASKPVPDPPAAPAPTVERAEAQASARSAAPATCPENALAAAREEGGVCLDPAALGKAVIEACTTHFGEQGWVRDADAEAEIGRQAGVRLTCLRKP